MNQKTTIAQRLLLGAQLFRLPMMVIIIGTQLLLRWCILQPFPYEKEPDAISSLSTTILMQKLMQ